MRKKVNEIAFASIFAILILVLGVGFEVFRLNTRISKVNQAVQDVDQAVSCPQVFNDGNTGDQDCISLNDQLGDIKDELDDVQSTVNNLPQF